MFPYSRVVRCAATALVLTGTCIGLTGCGDSPTNTPDEDAPQSQQWRVEVTALGSQSIWGNSENSLFVGGGTGYLFQYRNGTLRLIETELDVTLRDYWGTAADNVYALSADGIVHYDGRTFRTVYASSVSLFDIWGSSASDVWAVGQNGTIVHFDGSDWEAVPSGVTLSIHTVSGSSASNIYAMATVPGSNEFVLHYNGSAWSQVSVSSAIGLQALDIHSSGAGFLGDAQAYLFTRSGPLGFADFTQIASAPTTLAAAGALELFGTVADGRVFRWAGNPAEWVSFNAIVRRVWNAPWGNTYGVGDYGQVVYHDGTDWVTLRAARTSAHIHAVFGSPDGALFANRHFSDGTEWVERPLASPTATSAGWALSRDFAIAVGGSGTINHWDGTAWSNVASPTSSGITGVWAASETDAFAVTHGAEILHYDGVAWTGMTTVTAQLLDVHGTSGDDVWACGTAGRLFHYDGTNWTETNLPTPELLYAVWAVSPTNVHAVGSDGTAFHYDGTDWNASDTPGPDSINDLWARGPAAAFALTENGDILRFNGTGWTPYAHVPREIAEGLWGTPTHLYTGGAASTILRMAIE